MIPKSYAVGNFKAIGQAQQIQLKPITLIFGQNSAGKSSLIQSLLLCRFAMEQQTFDFVSTKRWGQTIDLGGFRQYIHRHEADRDLILRFGFHRSCNERTTAAHDSQVERKAAASSGDTGVPSWSFCFFNFLQEVSVEFAVGLPESGPQDRSGLESPVVKELLIRADGAELLKFVRDRSGHLQVAKLDSENRAMTLAIAHLIVAYREKLAREQAGEELDLTDLARSLGHVPVEETAFREVLARVAEASDFIAQDHAAPGPLEDLLASSEEMGRFAWIVAAKLLDEIKAPGRVPQLEVRGLDCRLRSGNRLRPTRLQVLPPPGESEAQDTGTALGSAVELEAMEDPLGFFCDDPDETDLAAGLAKALRFDLELMIDATLDSLKWWLVGTEYIGPYRSIPDRYFQIAKSDTSTEVDQGYQTLRRMAEQPQLLRRISNAFQDLLASPYRIELRKIAPSVDFNQMEEQLQRYLEREGNGKSAGVGAGITKVIATVTQGRTIKGVYLVDTRNGTDVDFCDVGFGIGQVLPLIAEVVSGRSGLVCIEQPEAHLHPKMQSDLADVFIQDMSDADEPRQSLFILETHSEHLILRLLRRIRESKRKKLPDGLRPLTPEQVSVVWVEAGEKGSVVTALSVNEKGHFIDNWPAGFFEERMDEIF